MNVKKCAALLLSAVFAVLALAGCGGRWDYSQEAAKAVNEAQGENLRVEFQVDQRFTDALHTAVNKNVQPEDVENAMLGDKDIQEMLHSGYRLDVYALRADADAEETARKIAEDYILSRLSGCKKEGYISMVKADNDYFYLAALTYKSSSGGGGGSSEPDKPEEPEKPAVYDVTTNVNNATLGTVSAPEKVEQGGEFTFTVTPASDNVTYKINVAGSCDYDNNRTVSNVQGPVTITVTFAEVSPRERAVRWDNNTKTLTCGVTEDGVTAAEEMGSATLTEAAIKKALALQSEKIADGFSLNQVEHLVVVNGSGVTTIGKQQFDSLLTGKKSLQSIDLSGVTKVEGMAFRQCEELSIVKAEDLKSIDGIFVFKGCTSLKKISLPALEEITDWYAFLECSSLETVDMPKVQRIPDGTFESCTSLKFVNLPEAEFIWDYAFAWGGSNGLTSVTLPKVTSLGYGAFSGCHDLFSVDLPAIQSIDYQAFSDCDKLVHIRLGPDLNYLQDNTFSWNESYTIYYGNGEIDFKNDIYDPDKDGVGKIKIYHGREQYETLVKPTSLADALSRLGITDTDTITYMPFSASIPAAPASLSNPVARLILNR